MQLMKSWFAHDRVIQMSELGISQSLSKQFFNIIFQFYFSKPNDALCRPIHWSFHLIVE